MNKVEKKIKNHPDVISVACLLQTISMTKSYKTYKYCIACEHIIPKVVALTVNINYKLQQVM